MKLSSVNGVKAAPVQQSRNITFGGIMSSKKVSELVSAAELKQKLTECQKTLKALEGTTSDPEFNAVLALAKSRLMELKSQRKPKLPIATEILN